MLEYIQKGDPRNPILFFIHGWPDTANVWDAQIDYFKSHFFCIAPHLPNFHKKESVDIDLREVQLRLAATIKAVLQDFNHERLVLICHDWGALYGYLLHRSLPSLIDKLVTIDVGADFRMENWRQTLGILLYQSWLISAFWIGKVSPIIGDWLTKAMASMVSAPRKMSSHSEMNYLYWYFWRELVQTGRFSGIGNYYSTPCQLLYLYGKKKPFQLHTREWVEFLNSRPDCRAIGLETDHWVMVQDPDRTNAEIESYILSENPKTEKSILT